MMKKQPANIVQLRDVTDSDLPIFFEQQLDADANQMAAFTAKEPTDRDAFDTHWNRSSRQVSPTLLIPHSDSTRFFNSFSVVCYIFFTGFVQNSS